MKKVSVLLFAVLLTGIITAGCSAGTASLQKEAPPLQKETAPLQKEAAEQPLSKAPGRIVVLTAADCEVVYALGMGDKVVGRGEYCDYPEEVLAVPSVQSGYETNIEQIISLKPDLVLMGAMDQKPEIAEQLEKAGITTYRSKADDIEAVYGMITNIAAYLDGVSSNDDGAPFPLDDGADAPSSMGAPSSGKASAAAEKLIESMKKGFAEIKKNPVSDGTKTVYFEVSPLEYGLWTAGKGTFMNEAAEMVGLRNCFDDVNGWAEISEEQVLERNPDYIVTVSMYYGEGPTPVEEILGRTGWEHVTAVKENRILNLKENELSRPGPRLYEGVKALYDFVK